jgi:hypothetical protein
VQLQEDFDPAGDSLHVEIIKIKVVASAQTREKSVLGIQRLMNTELHT